MIIFLDSTARFDAPSPLLFYFICTQKSLAIFPLSYSIPTET